MIKAVNEFFHKDYAGGVLLFSAAIAALIAANIPGLSTYYDLLIDTPVEVQVGALEIHKPLLLWVNDGLMALFFLLVGLELKHEFCEGELSDWRAILLPGMGAVGGMLVPALIYVAFNTHDPVAMNGWAIPAATDIAFALGVLTLLGPRVPLSVKVFLISLAIFDDLGAIVIIAVFYTSKISALALTVAAGCIVVLYFLNRARVSTLAPYVVVGTVMWIALLKSGVHATLAGVILAFFIPLVDRHDPARSPLRSLERDLHDTVYLVTLPVFAFCNAGIGLIGMGADQFFHSVPMGVAFGLFFGKLVGVFCFSMIPVLLGVVVLPTHFSKMTLLGVAGLCGIGFTMSLFIGSLAFEESGAFMAFDERLGILLGSFVSGLVGFLILKMSLPSAATLANESGGGA